jgi:hypothetical protein
MQSDWGPALAERVNRHGIAEWLHAFALWLGKTVGELTPAHPQARHQVVAARYGLILQMRHPHAGHVSECDPQRWVIYDAKFNLIRRAAPNPNAQPFGIWSAPLPYALDAEHETPASAQVKLTDNLVGGGWQAIAGGDRRIAYFLPQAIAVELTFRTGMTGLEMLAITGLGREQAWEAESTGQAG